ncbi:MAG: NAD(+)/NADH kinase [Clostridiales bacterium]|nr:NAD(+)/NADH kinase [Clostridiales bacterium]
MNLVLYYKNSNIEAKERMNSFLEYMLRQGCDCVPVTKESPDKALSFKSADFAVVFGGDGTVLEASASAAEYEVPMLCVNVGNLGFLSELSRSATNEEIASLLNANAKIIERMMLKIQAGGSEYTALNDAVIKSAGEKPLKLSAFVNGQLFDKYRSDGVIVATPTGSTAYALSAGGPILAPDLEAITFLPICPHTLHSRPAVVTSNSEIEIVCPDNATLIVDGRKVGSFTGSMTVKRADKAARFISVNNDFYKKLLDKMNRWGITH